MRPTRHPAIVTLALLGATASVTTGASAAVIDTASRAQVRAALVTRLRPALATPVGWSGGSIAGCRAGAPSAKGQAATLAAVNVYRALAGLRPVAFDAAYSAKAQQAALMMDANDDLSHSPPKSWKCYTKDGATAAGSSDLALGLGGAQAIALYMSDPGVGNIAAGHRRWLLNPPVTTFGSGSTDRANALWVFGATSPPPASTPAWLPWPTAGYVPNELEPDGRWSLGSTAGADFHAARVAVRDGAGRALHVAVEPVIDGYGSNTLVWEVAGLRRPTGTTAGRYAVTVSGIAGAGVPATYRYTVRLFNPDARLANTAHPTLAGTARVGQRLTARPGTWSPAAATYRYAWYRGATRIAGAAAPTYLLRAADRGRRVAVLVTASRPGYANGSARSAARLVG